MPEFLCKSSVNHVISGNFSTGPVPVEKQLLAKWGFKSRRESGGKRSVPGCELSSRRDRPGGNGVH